MPGPSPSSRDDSELDDSLELVRLAQDGEAVACAELFARYYPRVHALVRRHISDDLRAEMDSDDLLQDAMLNAIRGFSAFEVRSHQELIGWFARIVENHVRSSARHIHALKRDRDRQVSLEAVSSYMEGSAPDVRPTSDAPDPFELTAQKEQRRILDESLAGLDELQRAAIELRHGRKATWREIAEQLGFPSPDAARMGYVRARIELQKAIRRRGGGPEA